MRELGQSRADLEDARQAIATQRREDGLRPSRRRNSDKWVDPGQGVRGATPVGKIAAAIAAVALVLGVVLVTMEVVSWGSQPKMEVVDDSVTEALESTETGSCLWTVRLGLETEASGSFRVTNVWIDDVAGDIVTDLTLTPVVHDQIVGTARVVFELDECPPSAESVAHGDLHINYTSGGSTSKLTVDF